MCFLYVEKPFCATSTFWNVELIMYFPSIFSDFSHSPSKHKKSFKLVLRLPIYIWENTGWETDHLDFTMVIQEHYLFCCVCAFAVSCKLPLSHSSIPFKHEVFAIITTKRLYVMFVYTIHFMSWIGIKIAFVKRRSVCYSFVVTNTVWLFI